MQNLGGCLRHRPHYGNNISSYSPPVNPPTHTAIKITGHPKTTKYGTTHKYSNSSNSPKNRMILLSNQSDNCSKWLTHTPISLSMIFKNFIGLFSSLINNKGHWSIRYLEKLTQSINNITPEKIALPPTPTG